MLWLTLNLTLAMSGTLPAMSPQDYELRPLIEQYQADLGSRTRFYTISASPTRSEVLTKLANEYLEKLNKSDFDKLNLEGRLDWHLLKSHLDKRLSRLQIEGKEVAEVAEFLPFSDEIISFEESRRLLEPVAPKEAAETLNRLTKEVAELRVSLQEKHKANPIPKTLAWRAANYVGKLRDALGNWFKYSNGYDPIFSWWVEAPYKEFDTALVSYTDFLKEQFAGVSKGDEKTIIGDPIGRDALIADLTSEFIPYTPEELISIAEKEFAWCDAEMLKASRELGFGDDWKKALESVKNQYVEPGDQPKLIKELALEAIKFLEDRDMLTIPPLAKETWRMEMLSPEAQLRSPFFLGGEMIQVSYPTDTMSHDAKMMSMRGNNRHFSRATVQHELIPGHHMQQFMNSRYFPYRELFGTPFWVEGWALWWEMHLWNNGFASSPEDRIGMLFWRMHRCARIVFSLSFHLGKWTPQECIDFLVDRVGFERANAEAEVRRSFMGGYGPLYQLAYMIGGLQFRALYKELVESGKMTGKQFHDKILQGGEMPVAFVRSRLKGEKLTKTSNVMWKF